MMAGWMDGWMDGWTDRRIGWMDGKFSIEMQIVKKAFENIITLV